MRLIAAYIATAAVFAIADLIWLGSVAHGFYRQQLDYHLADHVSLPGAAVFYLIYVAGIVFFAVLPGIEQQSVLTAFGRGLALGFIAYATYDLTNYATLKDFPIIVVAVDLTWGTIVTGVAAAAGAAAALRI